MPLIDSERPKPTEEDCNSPRTRVSRGQPRKKRQEWHQYHAKRGFGDADLDAEALEVSQCRRRGNYGQIGHNKATCRTPHV